MPTKRVGLLLRAFAVATQRDPTIGKLRIVGAGPEAAALAHLTQELGISGRVVFLGQASAVGSVRAHFNGTFCAVSPGYVGLIATQAVGFGRPIIYSEDELNAPEVEAAGAVGSPVFSGGSVASLADAIVATFRKRHEWSLESNQLVTIARRRYSTETMAAAFMAALLDAPGIQQTVWSSTTSRAFEA